MPPAFGDVLIDRLPTPGLLLKVINDEDALWKAVIPGPPNDTGERPVRSGARRDRS